MARWSTCNILKVGPDARKLWQFDARNGDFKLNRQHALDPGANLGTGGTGKTWRSLWQPRLNVAWLPAEDVFLRVVHLPKSTPAETISMVELQLEKLSPIPLGQVVWSVHLLPQDASETQTVVVMLAERKSVEDFLGQLEGDGYLADRLELPVLDQVLATSITTDGAWIYPNTGSATRSALVAWWYGGVLRDVNFISLPEGANAGAALGEQVNQMVWAGELDGWLTQPPAWHIVADEAGAAEWFPPLAEALGENVTLVAPQSPDTLAALTARRAATADPKVNLLPQEFLTRYQQQFVDRLWMRGLFAVGAVYMVFVAIYFVALGVQQWRLGRVESKIAALGNSYTNAIQIEERYKVLKDRADLKFAALDCWKATAELLPDSAQLESVNFSDGKKFSLSGTSPKDEVQSAINFSSALRKATVNGEPLFGMGGDQFKYGPVPGGVSVGWSFSLELKRTEGQ